MGMKMGNLYEVAFNVEGWESDGQADVKMNMYEDGNDHTHYEEEEQEEKIDGTLYSASFENGTNYWSGRGSASVESTSSKAYHGSKSLFVSGRTDNWNGGEVEVDTSTFKPGSSYSFSTMVNPTESTTVQLSMQYDQNGSTNYTQIAEGTCTAGKWSKLENTNFTIPSGASNVKMYVEAPDSLCDIYVDRAIIANKGYSADGTSAGNSGSSATVPSNVKMDYNSTYKQMRFSWDAVEGADKYGIAVYLAGKWRVQTSDITSTTYTTPKNLTPNKEYKVAIAARVNGKWDTAGALDNYVTVITRSYNNIQYHTPSNTNNNNNNNENNNNNNNNNNNQQQTTSNYNYQQYMQFKEAPSYYFNSCSQAGKVVKESYNGINGYNSLNVYLPYGYDSSKKYNIFYLMHGGGENENTLFYQDDTMMQNLFDNMIKNGELEPLIVVTPTFNKTEAGRFYNEFRQSVVPFVEGKYSTYAGGNTSQSSLQASRMHRAYGGFSMGSVSTWAVMENCLDIVGYFMPLSGDHWNGNSAYDKAKSLANAIDKSGLQKNQYFIFAATGSDDIAYPNVNPQVEEMKKMSQFVYTSDFSKGNFYFMVASGKTHWWGYVRHYVYDALPSFFHEGQ
jgi:enterochelin esterase-like enzyme